MAPSLQRDETLGIARCAQCSPSGSVAGPSGSDNGRVAVLDPGAGRRRWFRNILQELLLLTGLMVALGVVALLLLGAVGLLVVLMAGLVGSALRPRVPAGWVL